MIFERFSLLGRIKSYLVVSGRALLIGVIIGASAGGYATWRFREADVQKVRTELSDLRGSIAEDKAAAIAKVRKTEQAAAQIAIKAAVEKAVADALLDAHYTPIIKKVPVYVSREADSKCTVPVGAVRLLNEAYAVPGSAPDADVSDAAGKPHDAPSGVALSTLVEVGVDNARTYYGVADQLSRLQAFIRDQQALSLRGAVEPK